MKNLILPFFLSLSLVQQLLAQPELRVPPTELAAYLASLPQTAGISAEGEVRVRADRAMLTFRVSTESKLLHDAIQANADVRGKLGTFLAQHGIDANRVQAGRFSSTEKHGPFSEKPKSHRVDNFVKVTVLSEKEFHDATEASAKFPDVSFVEVQFDHSEKERLKILAASQACDNAGQRKQMYEQKLGVRLSVKRFSESAPAAQRFPTAMGAQGGTPPFATASAGLMRTEEIEWSTAFGELVFRAQVTIEYVVEKK